MHRSDFGLKTGRGFRVKGFLSHDECLDITDNRKFESIEWEYDKSYRDCERVLVRDEALAHKLWSRLLPFLSVDDLAVRPYGYGGDGIWLPKGINPLFRISKYVEGGHFNVHRDVGFVVTDSFRSIYTFMVYLNDNGSGCTAFYDQQKNCTLTVHPTEGTALVFTHDCLHEGQTVDSGVKYVLRSDIMFQRTLKLETISYKDVDLYRQAEDLYHKSIRLQKEGQPQLSTEAFVQATEIHAHLSSMPDVDDGTSTLPSMPTELVSDIMAWLPLTAIRNLMMTCRRMMYKCRNPGFWHGKYNADFPATLIRFESNDEILTHDWFVQYGSRLLIEEYLPVVCVDVGARYTKFATTIIKCDGLEARDVHRTLQQDYVFKNFTGKINSVFTRNLGHYWSAGSAYCDLVARADDNEYHHWEQGRRWGGDDYKFFPFSFQPSQWHVECNIGVFLEIVSVIETYCLEAQHTQNPLVLAVPPFLDGEIVQTLILSMMPRTSAGFLAAISAPVLIAARHKKLNAIVVSIGARFAYVCVVKSLTHWRTTRSPYRCAIQLPNANPPSFHLPTLDILVHNYTAALDACRSVEPDVVLPVILSGGCASLYKDALEEHLGVTTLMTADPDMDVAVGGVGYMALPDIKKVLLKTPVVQRPPYWYKNTKLDWAQVKAAMQRYHVPQLSDSQEKLWNVLQNL